MLLVKVILCFVKNKVRFEDLACMFCLN